MPRPNHYDCEECEQWDDINGCWDNVKNIFHCQKYVLIQEGNQEEWEE
jgi:hypothetical protein